MNVITFDWTQITMAPSPLTTPFWAQLHAFGTFVVIYWLVGPILYYTNVRSLDRMAESMLLIT